MHIALITGHNRRFLLKIRKTSLDNVKKNTCDNYRHKNQYSLPIMEGFSGRDHKVL